MKGRRFAYAERLVCALALFGTGSAFCQKPAWIIGNDVVDFRDAGNGTFTSYALPIPSDVGPNLRYDGQVAQRSQYVQLDDLGRILFFVIDGAVYDRKGYLIADNDPSGTPDCNNCEECVPIGTSEIAVVQVPGSCSLFYLFTTKSMPYTAPFALYCSVLDLEAQNERFPGDAGKRGMLLDESSMQNAGIDLVSTYSEVTGGCRAVLFSLNDLNYGVDYVPDCVASSCNGALHMEGVDGAPGEDRFLVVTNGNHIIKWELLSTGIEYLGNDLITGTLYGDPWNECRHLSKGDLEVWRSGNTLKVAFTGRALNIIPDPDEYHYRILHADYTWNGTTLQIGNTDETIFPFFTAEAYDNENTPINQHGLSGLEYAPNGAFLYWTRSHSFSQGQQFGFVDLSAPSSASIYPLDFLDFVDTEIELNASDGGGASIYLCGKEPNTSNYRFGRWEAPNNAYALLANWEDNAYALPGITDLDAGVLNSDVYHLEMNQTCNDQVDTRLAQIACCSSVFTMSAEHNYTAATGSSTWTIGSNPFVAFGPVRFTGTLTIPSGASVTINDMVFEFGTDAGIIVEPGGHLYCNGCTLTNACDERWKGVEVRGNSNLGQTPFSNQGRFQTLNALVENAEVGAFVAKRNGNGGLDPAGYRGIVQSSNTTWKNNVIDVQIPSANGAGWTTWNQTRFQNCDFLTDQGWPDTWLPYAHAWLRDCGVIRFTNCRFRNTNTTFVGQDRGFGVFAASKAGPRVIGNNNPAVSFFEGLWCGVAVAKHRHYWVRNMDFRTSPYGIVDFGPTSGEVTGNTFNIPERGGQGPSPVGLLLYQTANYVVEDNLFQSSAPDANAGIAFWGPSETQNRIYNNNFEHLALGTYVIGDHQDEQNVNVIGLQKLCGDYTDNNVDYGMAFGSAIGGQQGVAGNPNALAGNRFFNTPDCSNNFDMAFVNPQPGSFFNYNRHDDVDCDVICENTLYMSDNFTTGQFFDLATSCADGFGNGGGINIVEVTAEMKAAKTQFESALAQYNGTVNGGKGADLLALINQNSPWLASHSLRDSLLANHPLGEELLLAMIHREEPMNGWHITQVMLQNAVLEGGVVETLRGKELVSPYQLTLIDQAQASGNTSIKDVLEDEMHEQGNRHYIAYVNCLRYWMSDTLTATAEDSILMALEHGIGTGGRMALLLYHLDLGNWSAMEPIMLEDWYLEHKHTYLRDYVSSMRSAFGNPEQLSTTELQHFDVITQSGDAGAGLCWGTLLELDERRDLPELDIPIAWRMYLSQPVAHTGAEASDLRVDPNPASGSAWVSWNSGLGVDRLSLFSRTGALVSEYQPPAGVTLFELPLRDLSSGLYLLRCTSEGVPAGETKLSVVTTQQR